MHTTTIPLLSHANWVSIEKQINEIGRTTPLPPPEDEETPPAEDFPITLPLNSLDNLASEWTLRRAPSCAGATPTSPIIARSLQWPGAVAVAVPGRYVCAYFGNCLSANSTRYCPKLPLELPMETTPELFTEEIDLLEDPTPPPPPEVELGEGEEEEGEGDADE
jgi:radial spoke head protein 4/6